MLGGKHFAGFSLLLTAASYSVLHVAGWTSTPGGTAQPWTVTVPWNQSMLNTTMLYPNTTAADPGLLYSDLIREFQVNIPATSTVGDLVVDMATLQTSNATNVTYVLMCCTYDVFTLLTDGRVMVTSELDFNIQYSIPVAELDSFGAILAGYVIHVNLTSNVTLYKDPDGLCNTTSFYVTMEENSDATVDLGSLVNQTVPPLQFSLVPGGDAARFSIDPSSGVLTNNAWLDREETDALVFRVALATRYDVTFATVTVAVTDVNDNPPVVVENWSSEYILQSTPINSIVGLVRGEDPDVGENATLTYTIEPEAGEDFSELFFINNVTGVITVISNFKFIREHIPLKVRVVDNGEPPRHVNTIVELSLLSNDAVGNLTRFEVSVPEDVAIGTALLNATVPASAGDGTVSYTYTMQDPSGINQKYFNVHNETGEVTLISGLDRETEPSHEFFVEPTSESGCDRQGLILVVIILEDINDNDPVFDHVTLRGTVRENTPVGELVTIIPELSVADQDSGIHGSVDIRLTGEGSDLFTVNSTTGQIYVSGNLDYETAQSYSLTVEARDMDGMPGYRSATARLTIELQDENDNPPQFGQDDFHFSIPENSADSALVGTVLATDRDSEHNGKVDHFIADGGDGLFRLDFSSGQLALVRGDLLDRETQDRYTLTVRAQDRGSPSLSTFTNVNVTVTDVNDNAPSFDDVTLRHFLTREPISTTENLPAGTRLFSLTVTDPDAGVSGSVHLQVDNDRFSVVMLDSSTQHWAIVNDLPLDREETDTYELGITAIDTGTPALSSSVTVLLSVGDVNDVPPTFLEPPDEVTLLGGSHPGTLVAIFAVEDPDVSGDIEYSIAMDRDRLFRIGDDGVVVLKRALPHAMDTNLTVEVTDGSHVADTTLQVHVEDGSSLSSLQFHSEQYDFDIAENSVPDTVIGTVVVSSDQPVRYSLQSAGTGQNFSIDSSTGIIRTQLQLDREVKDNHYMIVVATESSAGQFSFPRKAYAVVSVQVLDVNDNPPQFGRESYTADVAEDAPAGLIILNVSASDPDAGQNAHVVFSKVQGN
ncbi:cadherin EGF LAG seven-pass G-type receptor 2-like [Branchiostoma floridae x Branchiostoma belcheri]